MGLLLKERPVVPSFGYRYVCSVARWRAMLDSGSTVVVHSGVESYDSDAKTQECSRVGQ